MPRHHFRLPGRYTRPPVLSEDLSSEKTKGVTSSTWHWRRTPSGCTFCSSESPPNIPHRSTRGFINGYLQLTFALPKPISLHCSITFFVFSDAPTLFCEKALNVLQLPESPTPSITLLIIKRYFLSFFCWFFLHFNRFASSFNCLVHTLWVVFSISPFS